MQQRKQYFIDKQFQTRFIIKFCLINIGASILIGFLIYFLNRQSKTVAFENLSVVVKTTADFILPMMMQAIFVVTLFVASATVFIALLTSHRISGPLYRLTIEVDRMKNKDLSIPVKIRAKDQLKLFADECESMRVEYQQSIGAMKKNWQAVQTALSSPQTKGVPEKEVRELSAEFSKYKTE